MALEITDSNYKEILAEGKPVVVDFWAPWCGPCKMVAPIIEELAAEFEGQVIIGKCDVDDNSDVAAEYGIRNIPTVLFFKNGEIVDKQVGAVAKPVFLKNRSEEHTSELQSHHDISYAVFCLKKKKKKKKKKKNNKKKKKKKKYFFFFFNDTATTEIYTCRHTLSLHDALPIWSHDSKPQKS